MKIGCPISKKITALLFAFILFLSIQPVLAAESMVLTATPVRLGDDFSIKIAPGDKKQVQLKVRNGSSESVVLESHAVDFVVAEDGSTPVVLDQNQADSRWSLASWLTLAPAQHNLESEEVAVVNVLIEVPDDALPGGRYAMVYHRPLGANEAGFSGSGVSQRVGTLLYVIVDGPINEEANISAFNWPKFLENGPVDFQISVDNQSDVHINTMPVVKVYNMFGKQIANLETEAKNIFPKSEREFAGTWNKIWGFGYYKAVVEANYGSQGGVMTATAGLWMVPVKLIILFLVILLIVLIIFLSLKKRKELTKQASATTVTDLENHHEESDSSQDKT